MKLRYIIIVTGTIFLAPDALCAEDSLPERMHTSIDKILDDCLAEVENTLMKEKEFDPKMVLLVTVPLENFIEDVLFTINRPAVIYPKTIYRYIRTQLRQGKSREEIERSLVLMQKQNRFEKIYEAEKQK